MLLPSPRTSDTNGAGHHGDGGMDLRTAVAEIGVLCDGCDVRGPWEHRCHGEPCACPECREERRLFGALVEIPLLPTPSAERAGRNKSASEGAAIRWGLDYIDRLLPTPTARDPKGENIRGDDTCLTGALLPTPRATECCEPPAHAQRQHQVAGRAADSMADVVEKAAWGEYEPAIRRWEAITRPAPEPTKLNAKGNPKLSDEFDEWLMGLPAGWITDVPGVTWNETLKACGNGVLPQQAVAAIRFLLGRAAA